MDPLDFLCIAGLPTIKTNKPSNIMFYPNLYSYRMQAQYSQEYVGQVLNIDQSEYSRMESGKREPKANELNQLAKLYNTEVEKITEGSLEQMPIRKSNIQTVPIEIFERAESQRETLINALIEKNKNVEDLIQHLVLQINKSNTSKETKIKNH